MNPRASAFASVFVCMLALVLYSCGGSGPVTVTSPDGGAVFTLTTHGSENGQALMYDVVFQGTPVVTDSHLGVVLKGSGPLSDGFAITGLTSTSLDETYSMPYGKTAEIVNHCNETTVMLENDNHQKMELVIRAYDDGIAYRYRFPEQDWDGNLTLTGEVTSFRFDGDPAYWGIHLPGYRTSYETDYTTATLANITPDSLTALPVLVKVADDCWAAITEAHLEDYAGLYVHGTYSEPATLLASLSPQTDSTDVCVIAKFPHQSPWRVIMLGDNPGRLVESNIILNLNPPCTFDTSWIKAGKTSWDWWNGSLAIGEDFEGRMDTRTMKHYIDFSAEMGMPYMLIDAGWYRRFGDVGDSQADGDLLETIPAIDMHELIAYGRERNVGLWVWSHWTPIDRDMDRVFPILEEWGIKGVKIDFMDSDAQDMVGFYHRVAELAAEHHLMIDFHGAYKPTGLRRTWPNVMTREGVMGLEYSKWSTRVTPDHDCTIPFTRMLAGPIDYTPGGFSNRTQDQFVPRNRAPFTQGTRCHQLAMYVVFESPLQMVVDYPNAYRGKTGTEFLKQVPATWDDTHVLEAAVGDYLAFARKSGDDWYLGCMTDWTPRELAIPLDFLGGDNYIAEIYADGPDASSNAEDATFTQVLVNAGDTLPVTMAPGGGLAARFAPVQAGTSLPLLGE